VQTTTILPSTKAPQTQEDYAIIVENISKKFKIPLEKKTTLIERITSGRQRYQELWALRNITFTVKKGETLGIIGENGSGKSTLLKIIAGVLTPDSGSVKVNGKVASLLELGVGFQPDLTAEDNVRLYGTIMGMSKKEIEEKFEEIFEFAELERFRNMKLKNFSSGMYARLAFATAVATDPDILLIDEVLAVGDAAFRRKCLTKIDEIKRKNKTILIVSHNSNIIMRPCKQSIFLEQGNIRFIGSTEKVINMYNLFLNKKENEKFKKFINSRTYINENNMRKNNLYTKEIEIINVKLLDKNNKENYIFSTGDMMTIKIYYKINRCFEKPTFGVGIFSDDGTYIVGINTRNDEFEPELKNKEGIVILKFIELPLLTGTYRLTVGVCSDNNWDVPYDIRTQQYSFRVQSTKKYDGFVQFPHKWEVK